MKRKQLLPAALVLLSLCLWSCGGDIPQDTVSSETAPEISSVPGSETEESSAPAATTAETTEAPEPVSVDFTGKSGFKLITAATGGTVSANYTTVMNALLTQLKAKPDVKYSVANDTGTPSGVPELIFGKASRPGIDELYAELGPADYVVYVIKDAVVLLGGSPDATAKAGSWYLSNCLLKNVFTYEGGELYRYTSPDKLPLPSYTVPADYYAEKLKGLTVYAIGDSYFAGEGLNPKTEVWPALMAQKYGWTFENYGKGGSTVSDVATNNPMCRRISEMKDGSPDIVLFEGGANDWNHSVPLGEPGSKDISTFRGAVASCIEQLHAKYPSAKIVCISNWEYGLAKSGVQTTDFARAMIEVASSYDYTLPINASDTNVIPSFVADSVFRMKYSIKGDDRNHLNVEGMKYIVPYFEKYIGDRY